MTPVFGHGHLRLYLLNLLEESPKHGYELIQELGDRFGGTYVPSAGTIYPRLAKLEEEGLVTKSAEGRKTVYAITEAGRAELDARTGEMDGIEDEVTDSVRRLANEVRASVTDAMKTLRADLAAAAQDARQEARSTGKRPRVDVTDRRGDSAGQLLEAEMILSTFRHQVRAQLRGQVARGELAAETIGLLRSGLEELGAEVTRSLR